VEKATRERLTGATIFVAVAAIAVPELLSGPGEQAIVRESAAPAEAGPPLATYELDINPPAVPAGPREQRRMTPAPAEAIAQAAPPPQSDAARTANPPQPIQATPVPEAPATPAARPAGQAGDWWVQLGSFASEDNAQRLARELRGKGFTIEVARVKAGGKDLHRVRAGPVEDRQAATALKTRLGPSGADAKLVAP
jgi:DedD protein